jgi:hypothetical protein
MQRDLLVGGVDPALEKSDPESEWKGLGTAAFMLDRRFGIRKRPYLVHVAKAVSTPMLKELQAVFLDELTQVRFPIPLPQSLVAVAELVSFADCTSSLPGKRSRRSANLASLGTLHD